MHKSNLMNLNSTRDVHELCVVNLHLHATTATLVAFKEHKCIQMIHTHKSDLKTKYKWIISGNQGKRKRRGTQFIYRKWVGLQGTSYIGLVSCICPRTYLTIDGLTMSRVLRAVIMGPPGAGKGTISRKMAEEFKLFHLSSGDLLRSHVQRRTDVGEEARGYISKGCVFFF